MAFMTLEGFAVFLPLLRLLFFFFLVFIASLYPTTHPAYHFSAICPIVELMNSAVAEERRHMTNNTLRWLSTYIGAGIRMEDGITTVRNVPTYI